MILPGDCNHLAFRVFHSPVGVERGIYAVAAESVFTDSNRPPRVCEASP